MKFLIQPMKVEAEQINSLCNLLDVAGIHCDKVYPLEGRVLNPDKSEYVFNENEKYFVIGSYPLTRYVYKIKPDAVFSLDSYTFKDWYNIFGKDNMLNPNPQICLAKDINWIDDEMFVRPLEDTKSFNGGIYNKNTLKFEGECVVAHLQSIQKEFRFFVLNNKIIGQSQYKQNGELYISSIVDDGAIEFAKQMLEKFSFKGYTLDIAYVNQEYKIVELNCFNASGLYGVSLYNFLNEILTVMEE